MKSVTEFWALHILKGHEAKKAFLAEGKSPEEVAQAIGEQMKFEGDKLKHFVNALEVTIEEPQKLSRILVVSLNEGEKAPAKAVQIEESCYIPEFKSDPKPVAQKKTGKEDGGKNRKGKGGGGPKESPWGLSPEQLAAKKGKGAGAKKPE